MRKLDEQNLDEEAEKDEEEENGLTRFVTIPTRLKKVDGKNFYCL